MLTEVRSQRLQALVLVLLTLACASLGWSGVRCGMPHVVNPDEWIYLSQYRGLAGKPLVTQAWPRSNAYPNTWVRVAACVPRAEPKAPPATVEEHLEAASDDLLFLRRCVALLASLIVPATWFLARRFLPGGWSLFTAALAGCSVLQASFAAQARPHAIIAGAIIFALATAVDVARRGTLRASIVGALATGLAIAVLQSGLAACVPLAVAHVLRWRRDGFVAARRLALAGGIVVLILVLAYPGVLIDRVFPRPDAEFRSSLFSPHLVTLADFSGGGSPIVFRAFWFHDPLLLVASAAAIVAFVIAWLMRRRPLADQRDELIVVLAFVVPFLAALCLFQHTYYRFALPLFPIAALFAALALRAAGRVGVMIAGILLYAQFTTVVQFARLRQAPGTNELAAAWLTANADRSTDRIAMTPSTDLPLLRKSGALASANNSPPGVFQPWIDYQRTVPAAQLDALGWTMVDLPVRWQKGRNALTTDAEGFVRGLGADYVVIEVFEPGTRDILARVRAATAAVGHLVARFVPEGEHATDPHSIDPFCGAEAFPRERFTWRLFGASALGPELEIYRIDR